MTGRRRIHLACGVVAASLLALSACASNAGSGGEVPPQLGTAQPSPPEGDVVGQGTVMDAGGEVELCLGPVAESYPPQCSGIALSGWSWDRVDGSEAVGDVTWGAYAVQGRYDGEDLAVSQPPIMLALYDPMMQQDPTGGEAGAGDESTLAAIEEEIPGLLGDAYLSSYRDNGWLWVDVVWDDGTIQDAADAAYGEDVVVIRSALRPIDG